MSDLSPAIVAKSDQTNADDLIAGPRTITITNVTVSPGEQPVSICYQGDNGKPYKPCKSMCRVMVQLWGPDGKTYAGKSLTLFREPSVKFGGMEVGGIRISHASGLDMPVTLALTATKGRKAAFTVRPLAQQRAEIPAESLASRYATCQTRAEFDALEADRKALWPKLAPAQKQVLKLQSDATAKRVVEASPPAQAANGIGGKSPVPMPKH